MCTFARPTSRATASFIHFVMEAWLLWESDWFANLVRGTELLWCSEWAVCSQLSRLKEGTRQEINLICWFAVGMSVAQQWCVHWSLLRSWPASSSRDESVSEESWLRDQNSDSSFSGLMLHLWVETPPSNVRWSQWFGTIGHKAGQLKQFFISLCFHSRLMWCVLLHFPPQSL